MVFIQSYFVVFFFFFQAEDGIRDDLVTGVQTCALPISRQTSSEDISDTLNRLLLIESAPNETVFDWIDVNVTAEKRSESGFIRSLTQTVAKACISK